MYCKALIKEGRRCSRAVQFCRHSSGSETLCKIHANMLLQKKNVTISKTLSLNILNTLNPRDDLVVKYLKSINIPNVIADLIISYNHFTGKNEMNLIGHTEKVTQIKILSDTQIVSNSKDNTLKIWNIYTGKCENTLVGHIDIMNHILIFRDNRLITVSNDLTIKIWNTDTGICDSTLIGHTDIITHIKIL